MGIDWKRRILTVCVAVPLVIRLLLSSIGTAILATCILCGCLLEYRLNLCPQILVHVAGSRQANAEKVKLNTNFMYWNSHFTHGLSKMKGKYVHAGVLAALGTIVCMTATMSKLYYGSYICTRWKACQVSCSV